MTTLDLLGPALTDVGPDRRTVRRRPAGPLLSDRGYVGLVRAVAGVRLLCLALAAPAVLASTGAARHALVSLGLLGLTSAVLSQSPRVILLLIRHPLLALVDTAVSISVLMTVPVGQPATLSVVCTALLAGLVFPPAVLVVLVVPLVVASLGAPSALLGATPTTWQGWLALLSGLPVLVVGVCLVGSIVRHTTQALIRARHEVAEAVSAVGAADERARLARDMHDSVGKSIYGIALAARALRRVVEVDPQRARELAGALADAADQAAREARLLLLALREGQTDRPAVDVVTEVLAVWQDSTGIPASLERVEVVDVDPAVTSELVAALGEILHNVDKHARASAVRVALVGDGPLLELRVGDDGVGFEQTRPSGRETGGHFGLRGLRERAEQLGGTATIESEPQKGTTVTWTARRHPSTD
jgi:signal transduction histidine kinase